ncbi:condensation domain-containing protein [Streptomyces sp. NPDC058398]|uniref:condensation domain-containing protein n=1 Tax=Streptomyces sp. NPDC058398 TaxID=3346479 RepID=UPI0036608B94
MVFFPLAPEQRSMMFLEGLFGPGIFHNMSVALPVGKHIDDAALRDAIARLHQRQAALRSALVAGTAYVQQVVPVEPSFTVHMAEAGESVGDLLRRRRSELLNLPQDRGVPGRVRYELLGEADGPDRRLLVTLDHFVCDGYAAGVVARELAALLDRQQSEPPVEAGELPTAYPELCRVRSQTAERADKEVEYWTRALDGVLPLTNLAPHTAQDGTAVRAQVDSVHAGPAHHAQVEALGERYGATPFSVMATLTAAAIWARTGRQRFALFSPLSGRHDPASQAAVGCFAQDRPVVCHVTPEQRLSDCVKAALARSWRSTRNTAVSVADLVHRVPAFGQALLADGVDYVQLHVWMETETADGPDAAPPVDTRRTTHHGVFRPARDLTVTTLRFGFSPRRTTVRAFFGGPAQGLDQAEDLGAAVLSLLAAAAAADGDVTVGELVELVEGARPR